MRQLSAAFRVALVATAFTAFVACDSSTAPITADGVSASLATACPGNSGGDCSMSVSVVLTDGGAATLDVRTGVYDATTGTHAPNGTFEKIQYKIFSAAGKLIETKNVDASGVAYQVALTAIEVGYRVEVQANIRNHSGKKGTSVVRSSAVATAPVAQSTDISVSLLARQVAAGGSIPAPALGLVTTGSTHRYTAQVSSPTGSAATTATCSATLNGAAIPASDIQWVTSQVTVASGGTAACIFDLKIPLAGTYALAVSATAANDPNVANNTVAGSVVVAAPATGGTNADLAWTAYYLTVGTGAPQSVVSIAKGKTATYRVVFHNNSGSDATSTCMVTAQVNQGLPAPLSVTSVNPMLVAANGDYVCTFDYTFDALAVVKFTVAAANVSPNEATPADNVVEFTTTALSDNTFPSITITNVHVLQRYTTDGGSAVTLLEDQSVNFTRITLTFTQTRNNIGDFTLSGIVRSGGNTLSSASWTVNDLAPGVGGMPNCVTGVNPGAQSVIPATIRLKICAQAVADDPSTQAIYVEYNTEMTGGPITNPDPTGLVGNSVQFGVNLDWTLEGSTIQDHASAELLFDIKTVSLGIRFPNQFDKSQTGALTVIRNGGA